MKKLIIQMKQFVVSKSRSENIAFILIAVIVTASMSTLVNIQVDKIHSNDFKMINITFLADKNVNSDGHDVCIINNAGGAPKDAFSYILQAVNGTNVKYEYIEKKSQNEPEKILIDASTNSNLILSIKCPYFTNTSIDFISNSKGGKIRVECEAYSREFDLYRESGQGLIRCTPISESYGHLIPYFLIYIFIFPLVLIGVYFLKYGVFDKVLRFAHENRKHKLIQYDYKIDIPIIFVLLSAFLLTQYFSGSVPGYLNGGDQNLYWNQISALSNMEDFKSIPDFRGYLCYLIPAVCKSVEFHLGINSVALWILFLSFLATLLFGFTFPMLSKKFYGMEITRPSVYLSLAIMCIFQRGLLLYVLMDFPAAVFFLSGFTLLAYFLESPGIIQGGICGVFFAIAVNLKVNYQFVVAGSVLIWTIYYFTKKCKNSKLAKGKICLIKYVLCVGALIIGFVIVSTPQLLINYSKGVISFAPFQTETSWNDKNYMIEELAASRTFENMRLYPGASKADYQVRNIKIDYIGDTTTLLNYQQLFEMFIRKPLDTLIYMAKKLFIGFNTLNPFVYAGGTYTAYENSTVWILCLLNYTIIFSGLFLVFKRKGSFDEKLFLLLNFSLAILPGTFTHVEWRGYIVGYLLTNFFFCFSFLPALSAEISMDNGRIIADEYYKELTFFLIVEILICATVT